MLEIRSSYSLSLPSFATRGAGASAAALAAETAARQLDVAVQQFTYNLDDSTNVGVTPGNGNIRFDNTSAGIVTEITIADVDANASNRASSILGWLGYTAGTIQGRLVIKQLALPAREAEYFLTDVTDLTNYSKLSVTPIKVNNWSHTDGVALAVSFRRTSDRDVAGLAPIASPAFTGTPTAPTPPAGNNTGRIANTAFVTAAVSLETAHRISAVAIEAANRISDVNIEEAARIAAVTAEAAARVAADTTEANNREDGDEETLVAAKDYTDLIATGISFFDPKGTIDVSGNPNYPAADKGDMYIIVDVGKIGGASGVDVADNDYIFCLVDGSAAGTQAAVGANWSIVHFSSTGTALLAGTLPFSEPQVIEKDAVGPLLTLRSLASGTTGGPNLRLERRNPTPASNQDLGAFSNWANNSALTLTQFMALFSTIVSPTAGAESARGQFSTKWAGTTSSRFLTGAGIYSVGSTGADKGVDTLNWKTLYQDGQTLENIPWTLETLGAPYTMKEEFRRELKLERTQLNAKINDAGFDCSTLFATYCLDAADRQVPFTCKKEGSIYMLASAPTGFEKSLVMDFNPEFWIVGLADPDFDNGSHAGPIFRPTSAALLEPTDGLEYRPSLFTRHLQINNNARLYSSTIGAGGSGVSPRLFDNVVHEFYRCYGATRAQMEADDLRGDAGGGANECSNVLFWHSDIRGQADLAYYFTDDIDNDPSDVTGGGYAVIGGRVQDCTRGVKTHQQGRRTRVLGVEFKRVGVCIFADGFSAAPIGIGGIDHIVEGCMAKQVQTFASIGIGRRASIIGNDVEDFSYNPFDPVTPAGTARAAIYLNGGKKNIISNNNFRMVEWDGTTGSGARAIYCGEDVVASDVPGATAGTYQSTDNLIDGNLIDGLLLHGIYEDHSSNNNVGDNLFGAGVATKHRYATDSVSQLRVKGAQWSYAEITDDANVSIAAGSEIEVFILTGARTAIRTITLSESNMTRRRRRIRVRNDTTGGFAQSIGGLVSLAAGASADFLYDDTGTWRAI